MEPLNDRRRVMGEKPLPYDSEVEYIESSKETGIAYFITDYVPEGLDIEIYIKLMPTGSFDEGSNLNHAWYDTMEIAGYRQWRILQNPYETNNFTVLNAKKSIAGGRTLKFPDGNIYECVSTYTSFKVNGIEYGTAGMASDKETGHRLYIFNREAFNGGIYGRLYGFYVKKAGKLELDLIPVRKGGRGYMFDRVSGRLLESSGPGEFICGPDLNKLTIKGKFTNNSNLNQWWVRLCDTSTNTTTAQDTPTTNIIEFVNPDTKEFLYTLKTPTLLAMFHSNTALERIDGISGTDAIKSFCTICRQCSYLKYIDLSSCNTENVEDIRNMFDGCSQLTEINLANWDTSNVQSAACVFWNCSRLKSLNISGWDFINVQDTIETFNKATSLTDVIGPIYNLKISIDLSPCPLTNDSAMVFINGLSEVEKSQTIKFSSTTYNTLTEEQIKIATDKGWTVTHS